MFWGYRSHAVPDHRTIGVDVGGTKIHAGRVSRDCIIERSLEIATPTGTPEEVLQAIEQVVRDLLVPEVGAIGIGVPIPIDRRTGVVLEAVNLPLSDIDLGAYLRDLVGLPAAVENDANAAALAEWRVGAGQGTTDMVMLTLGTGVGGGLILGGRLYSGWAELGHVVVLADGPPCQGHCHGRGHLEGLASGTAADAVARRLYGEHVDARMLVSQARAGDAEATAELAQIGRYLGAAVGSFVNMFDPDVVVVGGGFGSAAGDLVLESARVVARREALPPADERVRIVPAELGLDAGVVGAALVGYALLDGER
jgi:glucokinase